MLRLPAVLTVLCFGLNADPMTKGERDRLLAHLGMTESWLRDEIAGLSTEQASYRAREGAWSFTETVEHLAVAEEQYWKTVQDSLATPAAGYKSPVPDDRILWYGIDRTQPARTGEARNPAARFKSPAEAFAVWSRLRNGMTEYVRTTEDDLRGRQLKGGSLDVYQWLVMISAHSQRHILQLRELKHDPGFPKRVLDPANAKT
jgi:hypothetical protein